MWDGGKFDPVSLEWIQPPIRCAFFSTHSSSQHSPFVTGIQFIDFWEERRRAVYGFFIYTNIKYLVFTPINLRDDQFYPTDFCQGIKILLSDIFIDQQNKFKSARSPIAKPGLHSNTVSIKIVQLILNMYSVCGSKFSSSTSKVA